LPALQERNTQLLGMAEKNKEQLKFSTVGKVLQEDEQFAKEIL